MKKDLTLSIDTGSSAQGLAVLNDKTFEVNFSTTLITGSPYSDGQKKETKAGERRKIRSVRKRYARKKKQTKNIIRLFEILNWLKPEEYEAWLNLNPYILRVKGLTEALTPFEFSRVLYNFLHHRGINTMYFTEDVETSDKKIEEPDEDSKKIKDTLKKLSGIIGANEKYTTIGQYLLESFTKSQKNNLINPEKFLCYHIYSRESVQEEFELIYNKQSELCDYLGRAPAPVWNKILEEVVGIENRKKVKKNGLKYLIKDYIIFYLKPAKSYKKLIGECCCIPWKKRSPSYCSDYQDYRIWDQINNLKITDKTRTAEKLNAEERNILKEYLDKNESILVSELSDLFSNSSAIFNFKGNKKIVGNKTNQVLRDIIPGFLHMDNQEKDRFTDIIFEHLKLNKRDSLVNLAQTKWNLTRFHALKLLNINLETDRKEFSRDALKKINSYMKYGELSLYEIKEHLGFEQRQMINLDKISNPDVKQVVSSLKRELRKIKAAYGDRIKVARVESNKSFVTKKQAEEMTKVNGVNEKFADEVKTLFSDVTGFRPFNPKHILKGKLFLECGGVCPYTGMTINKYDLFTFVKSKSGELNPKWSIEHIIPKSKCGGNDYNNLTLCEYTFNSTRKSDRSPLQMKHEGVISNEEYEAMLSRVLSFKFKNNLTDNTNQPKYKKFIEDIEADGFINSQLNDTRYITKIVMQLVKEEFNVPVQGVKHNIVSILGNRIDAHELLKDSLSIFNTKDKEFYFPKGKDRLDHRHHAIDAILVGLASKENYRLFTSRHFDFTTIKDNIKNAVERVLVNHPNSNKVRGMLHQSSCYGYTGTMNGKKHVYTYAGVKYETEGRYIEIKYPDGNTKCYVSGNIHHLPIFKDSKGVLKTRDTFNKAFKANVSMYEAYQRKRIGEDIHKAFLEGVNGEYFDSFHINDMLIIDPEEKADLNNIINSGDPKLISQYLYRVESIDGNNIRIRHHLLSYKKASLAIDNYFELREKLYSEYSNKKQLASEELRKAEETGKPDLIKEAKDKLRKIKFDTKSLTELEDIGGYKKSVNKKTFKTIKINYDIFGNINVLNKFNL